MSSKRVQMTRYHSDMGTTVNDQPQRVEVVVDFWFDGSSPKVSTEMAIEPHWQRMTDRTKRSQCNKLLSHDVLIVPQNIYQIIVIIYIYVYIITKSSSPKIHAMFNAQSSSPP